MPLRKVKGGWTFGGAVYRRYSDAVKAYQAYLARKRR